VHVLVVDDQPAFRRAAARVVARLPGFELIGESETGEASVQAAHQLQPDLVLMDIHLPGIDGPEATRRILAAVVGQSAADRLPAVDVRSSRLRGRAAGVRRRRVLVQGRIRSGGADSRVGGRAAHLMCPMA
jgi:DNA-binding NarL/FixJ family response regulator